MEYDQIKNILAEHDQLQVLRFYDELTAGQQQELLSEIESIDFGQIEALTGSEDSKNGTGESASGTKADPVYDAETAGRHAQKNTAGAAEAPLTGNENGSTPEAAGRDCTLEPLPAMRLGEIEEKKEQLEKTGLEALKAGKVAAVLLAGGQGSRLGWNGPKGTYNIGVTKDLYIFECLFNNLMQTANAAQCRIPLLIMTSKLNDTETRRFLAEHDYFGYGKENVRFFVQDMAPATDFNGKILLEEKGKISLSPNGNGGWFGSMCRAGLTDELKRRGVVWLNLFSVDNVLQKIAEPAFVGATILSGCESSSKVVGKRSPDEKVGVMCKRNGRPSIVEYFELPDEERYRKGPDGTLAFNWGVILNYMFRIDALERTQDQEMKLHLSKKKIPYINDEGEKVSPEEPNGYKYEKLITDLIEMMDSALAYEVRRETDFAPVKNAEGSDSVQSARELLRLNGVSF